MAPGTEHTSQWWLVGGYGVKGVQGLGEGLVKLPGASNNNNSSSSSNNNSNYSNNNSNNNSNNKNDGLVRCLNHTPLHHQNCWLPQEVCIGSPSNMPKYIDKNSAVASVKGRMT